MYPVILRTICGEYAVYSPHCKYSPRITRRIARRPARSARILALAPDREHAPELLLETRAHLLQRLRVVTHDGFVGAVVPAEHREIKPHAFLAVRLVRILEGAVAALLRRCIVAALLRDRLPEHFHHV